VILEFLEFPVCLGVLEDLVVLENLVYPEDLEDLVILELLENL
jgi:hypothetical protein